MNHSIVKLFCLLMLLSISSAYGEVCGKLDIGPSIIEIDLLQSGKTQNSLHMEGVKADATIIFRDFLTGGFALKPGVLLAAGNGNLEAGTIGIGHYIPVCDSLILVPSVGVGFSHLGSRTNLTVAPGFTLYNLKQQFRSFSPFVAMEVTYIINEKWSLLGMYQYAWSRTHTKIHDPSNNATLVKDKSHADGANYALGVEYSFNKCWSVIFGIGYNESLSKEKHGLRGKGAKIGVGYYF